MGAISHYKNFGNWQDSLDNYGTQKCYGTILIDAYKKNEDWKMFCEGMDQDRSYFVLEYFRNSDMTAGTGSYIFIMEQENGKVLLVQNANMLLII